MVARRSAEQLLVKFHHLYDVFDACLAATDPIPDFFDLGGMEHLVISRQDLLGTLASGAATPPQLVSGVQDCVKDFPRGLRDLRRNRPQQAQQFEDSYQRLRGVSLADDLAKARAL